MYRGMSSEIKCDSIPNDLWRVINCYLTCRDAIRMEIALRVSLFTQIQYRERYKYEPRSLNLGFYYLLCSYYKSRFKIVIEYQSCHQMVVFDHTSNTTKEALRKIVNLFKIKN
jgi:hypothetical protein